MPYLVSVIWAGKPLNIPVFKEFYDLMVGFFGPSVRTCVEGNHQIDAELQGLFENLMATPQQVNILFRHFCDKYELDVAAFNKVGHNAPIGDLNFLDFTHPGVNFGPGNTGHQGQGGHFGGPGGGGGMGGGGGGMQLP